MNTEPSGPVRKRVRKPAEQRREEILDAAVAVFAGQGYRAADCQDIADRAEVGKGTVYRYFETKEVLFLSALTHVLEQLKSEAEAAVTVSEDPLEKIRAGVRVYLAFFDAQPEVVELFIQERAEFREHGSSLYFVYADNERGGWLALVQELVSQGRLRVGNADAALQVLEDLLFGTVVSSRLAMDRRSLRERAGEILDIFEYGVLRTP